MNHINILFRFDIMLYLSFFKNKKKNQKSKEGIKPINEMPDYVVNLDEKSFNDFIKKYPLSVIDFWASWCNPCKSMAPRLRRLSKLYSGKVVFGKIDIEKDKNISKQYKIMGIPHLIFFKYGKKISSINGLKSVGYIKKVIEDLLSKEY